MQANPQLRKLMCKPTYFSIAYSINPWMRLDNPVNPNLAWRQWQSVYDALIQMDVKVELIEPAPGLADMTFAGDCGLAVGGRFLAGRYRHPERRPEIDHYVRWFEQNDYEITRMPDGISFEGLGDVVWDGKNFIFGYGKRSSIDALPVIQSAFPELTLLCQAELNDERFYHAGLAISLLGNEKVLFYPGAFTLKGRDAITERFPDAIAVSDEDALQHFVCNNIVVADKLLMAGCSPALRRLLADWDYQVHIFEMSEYKKSGASLRCLALDLV